ncbi:MAG: amino acid ABC transporter permease [Proteobacteria bacterium]|nr:amino acid ABC transporter permease [Pseudomonadota bacterium]
MNYNWNWGIFWATSTDGVHTWFGLLLSGLAWTLFVSFCAAVIALVIGSIIGIIRTTPNKWLVGLGNAYVELFRNIPLLVQLFLWYFVLPEVVPKGLGDAIKAMSLPWASFVPAVIGLGLFTSARVAEQVRAGIQALPRGQRMAGTALGLTLPQVYRYVLLPMAYRIILPPLTSETMNLIKNSSVALTIGLIELTAAARAMQEFTFQVFEAFTAATIIYIVVNLIVVNVMRIVEKRTAVPGFIGPAVGGGGH